MTNHTLRILASKAFYLTKTHHQTQCLGNASESIRNNINPTVSLKIGRESSICERKSKGMTLSEIAWNWSPRPGELAWGFICNKIIRYCQETLSQSKHAAIYQSAASGIGWYPGMQPNWGGGFMDLMLIDTDRMGYKTAFYMMAIHLAGHTFLKSWICQFSQL